MIIERKPPPYPRQGPSCLLVIFVVFGIAVSLYVLQNIEQVREIIIPTPTPEPTRTSTELAILAELSKGDGDFEDAIGYYEQAVTLDATRPEIYVRLIDLLVRQGQAELAVEKADQAVVLAPDSDRVLTASAAAYIANGEQLDDRGDSSGANLQYAHAFGDALKAKNNNPQNATALAYAALGLVFQGNPELYSQAEELADEALLLEPNNPFVRYTMGQVFTLQAFYLNALEQFQLGIQSTLNRDAQQEWPIGFEETDLHYAIAYNSFADGRLPDAILSFQDALDIDPENAAAYDGLAHMYIQLGDAALAEKNALESVRLNPNVARSQGRLGEAFFRNSNFENAIPPLEKATALYGATTSINARFFNMLANAYINLSMGECPRAVPLFEQVIDSTTNSTLIDSARSGIDECRRAALGQTQ